MSDTEEGGIFVSGGNSSSPGMGSDMSPLKAAIDKMAEAGKSIGNMNIANPASMTRSTISMGLNLPLVSGAMALSSAIAKREIGRGNDGIITKSLDLVSSGMLGVSDGIMGIGGQKRVSSPSLGNLDSVNIERPSKTQSPQPIEREKQKERNI